MKKSKWFIGILILMLLVVGGAVIAEENAVVVLPESLKVIEEEAFCGDVSLKKVIVSEGATEIGSRAFADSSLSEIELPGALTYIADDAFEGCENLLITAPEGSYAYEWAAERFENVEPKASPVEDFRYSIYDAKDAIAISDYIGNDAEVVIPAKIDGLPVKEIGYRAFYYCSSLTSITIPDSVISINVDAFSNCSNLTSITIPSGVTSIKASTFSDCDSLTNITIPDSVISIGTYAFSNCSSLTSITIPDSVTSIGTYAFSNCSSLTSMTIPNSVTSIEAYAFKNCSSLTSITIPDSVTSIEAAAFYGCNSLTSITIPDGVSSIEDSTFRYCSRLTSITIPDGVTSIEAYAFKNCSSLTNITIPDGVTSIGERAFDCCFSLTSITIPDSVTSIGNYAFSDCGSLTSVTIPDSVTSIGKRAFGYCFNLKTIYGQSGSYAEEWAEENGYEFIAGTGPEPEVTPEPTVTVEPIVTPEPTTTPAENADWEVSYDTYYTTITVTASGTPVASKAYLFVAENAEGGHHSGTIAAGETSASFRIKDLQMPRAAKYSLFVLPSDVTLTDANRDEYFIADVVLPLWEGGMINAVRSGGIDVTDKKVLFVDDEIEIDWDGSFGVETTEISVTLNGTPVTIDEIKDKDGPETVKVNLSELSVAVGDVLEVTVTVTAPDNAAEAMLEAAGHEPMAVDIWEWTLAERLKVSSAAIIDGENRYDAQNGMQLVVGDHNYQNGYTLEVQSNASADVVWTVYTDDPSVAKAYRTEDGLVYIRAKKPGTTSIYISDTYVPEEKLEALPEKAYIFEVCIISVGPTFQQGAIMVPDDEYIRQYILDSPENTNVMENETIGGIIRSYLLEAEIGKDRTNQIISVLRKAPTIYRNLFIMSLLKYDIEVGDTLIEYQYDRSTKTLNVPMFSTNASFIASYFHESGHALDDYALKDGNGYISMSEASYLYLKLEEDVRNYIRGHIEKILNSSGSDVTLSTEEIDSVINGLLGGGDGSTKETVIDGMYIVIPPNNLEGNAKKLYIDVVNAICKELSKIPVSNTEMAADIMSGMTNNKLWGGSGHEKKNYWFTDEGEPTLAQCREAWAEFFAAKITRNEDAITRNRSFFPLACEFLEELAAAEHSWLSNDIIQSVKVE